MAFVRRGEVAPRRHSLSTCHAQSSPRAIPERRDPSSPCLDPREIGPIVSLLTKRRSRGGGAGGRAGTSEPVSRDVFGVSADASTGGGRGPSDRPCGVTGEAFPLWWAG